MDLLPEQTTEKLGFDAIKELVLLLCDSEPGREWIENLTPVADPDVVALRLSRTGELMKLARTGESLPLGGLPDIREALRTCRAEGSVLDATAIMQVFDVAVQARRVKHFLEQRAELIPGMANWAESLIPLKAVEEAISRILNEQGAVRDSASPELQTIRRQLASRRNDLRTTLARIQRQAAKDGVLAEQEPTIRAGRMVLAVKAEHKRKISGFVHDVSATGQTVYLEPVDALHINNDIRQLENDELREIERLLRILTGVIREHRTPLASDFGMLAALDGKRAIMRISLEWDGTIAEVRQDDRIRLIDAANALLLIRMIRLNRRDDVVPLTLEMEPDERCLVITGPNAGGKSVALKTLGLLVLLTQCGFAIPAREGSGLPIYNAMMVDMGDDQSIETDLSTFSSRLTWIKHLFSRLTYPPPASNRESASASQVLVLIDEAATGTDPAEGVALYQALMEALIEAGARQVVTTHHGQLKVFAHNHPAAVNGSMEFDRTSLSPTYRFRKGVPGSSYAFEIAQRTGVPGWLTGRAGTLLGDTRNHLEGLISELENQSLQASEQRAEAEKRRREAEQFMHTYEEKLRVLNNERNKIREKALLEAKFIMAQANRRVEEAVERVVASKARKQDIKAVRKELDEARNAVHAALQDAAAEEAPKETGTPPSVGDRVKLADGTSTGELIERNGKHATVLVNGLRLRTRYEYLRKVVLPAEKKQAARVVVVGSADGDGGIIRPVRTTLDVRGKNGEEAVQEVMHFVDEAAASGLGSLEIIHGKGDGILRKRVHEYLKNRKEVKAYHLAPWEQGGPGCTLVTL